MPRRIDESQSWRTICSSSYNCVAPPSGMVGSTMGHRLTITSYGESHGSRVGCLLAGCPAGLAVSEADIQYMLDMRRPGQSLVSTQRKESDRIRILSGIYRGRTTGAPIAMEIQNENQRSEDYSIMERLPRPGHSDYPASIRYGGYNDPRGGGIFSGRLTATQVMAGAVARKLLLETLNIQINSYTLSVGNIRADITHDMINHNSIYSNIVRCPNRDTAGIMEDAILEARRKGDTLGGVIESITTNVPPGIGEPIYHSLESDISAALFSIPSVKGVEFGSGFAGSGTRGSQNNDSYHILDNHIRTKTNNAGGILGGLATGMPIHVRAAFKPASSIAIKQDTVNTSTMEPAILQVGGRHDPCVVPRAPPVVDSMLALVLADHCIMSGQIGQVIS